MRFVASASAFSVGFVLGLASFAAPSIAADALNIYSARHYDSDELLYDGFQKATGVPVNVIEGDGPELIAHWGPEKAEQWVKGVVKNFARAPQGADTTLLQSVAAGECAVTIANHYYFVRLETSKSKAERDAAAKLTPIFPNQDDHGANVNISGGGVIASAPHKAVAVKFLEFMASDAAQNIIANANYEFPAVASG